MTPGSENFSSTHLTPMRFVNPFDCAEQIIERLGPHLKVAMPLGIGKPNHLINALYTKAVQNPHLKLELYTALSLLPPDPGSGLAARLLKPFLDRQYANYPLLAYEIDRRAGVLPDNVTISEFFLQSGSYLNNPGAQQNYISSNYTHVLRDLINSGINVLLQMVARSNNSPSQFSLSSNPDLSLDLIAALQTARSAGQPVLLACEVSRHMPFLPGSSEVPTRCFDVQLEHPDAQAPLFVVPNEPIDLPRYAIATHISSLIKDGGTLQIGIGPLGDALAQILTLRQQQPESLKRLYRQLTSQAKHAYLRPQIDVHSAPFKTGLYALSEMLVQGFLHLRSQGILKRSVTDPKTGVNHYAHGGFYVGSSRFYADLHALGRVGDTGLDMTRIGFINQLYGNEALKREQRLHARFINSAMMVTLGGAVVSDGLEDGRVVSGVGGQYNFVAMAHELENARSVIALPSTRISEGRAVSNIVYQYGQNTIPRHLRDVVVTEYGVADLRGQSDEKVMARLLAITDSRFQRGLITEAKRHGKLPESFELPACFYNNRPGTLLHAFDTRSQRLLPRYPLGTDFNDEEAALMPAFQLIKSLGSSSLHLLGLCWRGFKHTPKKNTEELLEYLNLLPPGTLEEKVWRYLVLGALSATRTNQPLYSDDAQAK